MPPAACLGGRLAGGAGTRRQQGGKGKEGMGGNPQKWGTGMLGGVKSGEGWQAWARLEGHRKWWGHGDTSPPSPPFLLPWEGKGRVGRSSKATGR